jgi:hypothetical protein
MTHSSNDLVGNAAMEFHDSTVASASTDGASVTVVISPAYIYRSSGRRGVDRDSVWLQDAVIVLHDCHLPIEVPKLPLALHDGLLVAGEHIYDGTAPLPLTYVGPSRLDLTFEDGTNVRLSATAIRIEALGEATYLEEAPGADTE